MNDIILGVNCDMIEVASLGDWKIRIWHELALDKIGGI
jgi:hypothetical protein